MIFKHYFFQLSQYKSFAIYPVYKNENCQSNQANLIFLCLSPRSVESATRFSLYSLTFLNFWSTILSTSLMNISFSELFSHSPSFSDTWFSDMTSSERFEMVFIRFLLKAYANSFLAAFLIFVSSSVSLIFCFRMAMIEEYWPWMFWMSCWVCSMILFWWPSL